MNYILLIIVGYLIGTIPCSYLVGKMMGNIDVREHGSGNAGATNVLRTVGKKAALYALIGDVLKGVIPAIIGQMVLGMDGAVLCAIFAVIGHCYPITLGFKGGKGVATAGGMIIGTNPLVALGLFIYMFGVIKTTKYVSLASITAAIIYPITFWILYDSPIVRIGSIFLGALIVFKHRANIQRLLSGNESKTTLFDK
ncbi:glycerol-3-phosphate 1-O-acyltransferase PlsY [Acidaminobacter sp. JC074]|uniref:glycerol-3-phosphate 1-O-acyltransferase PlsY n=1 Tax=Acidaminobacter sp. JC074 TaxID=2530199 RepID=UPI001F107C71|nr:glycerol-3-phosphate 1-O-acyltransferase PlsY [Acidaminobacter sp. JC074]